jgi:hypothetical protein
MTSTSDVETRLHQAFAYAPTADALERLDDRVAAVMAVTPAPVRARGFATSLRRGLLLRPLAVLAAFVLMTGAVAGTLTLLERLSGQSTVGTRVAWERAEVLGIRQVDAGLTVILERAYVDLNQVVLFLEVEGLSLTPGVQPPPSVDIVGQLHDPAGRPSEGWALSLGGIGDQESGLAAAIMSWEGPILPQAGIWNLRVSSVGYGAMTDGACTAGERTEGTCTLEDGGMRQGTWQFEFDMPSPAGKLFSGEVATTIGDATVTLTELRLAQSMIGGELFLEVGGRAVPLWSPTLGSIRHNGEPWEPDLNPNFVGRPFGDGGFGFLTSAGTNESAGTWEIEISHISLPSGGSGEMEAQLEGPWMLSVAVR